MRYFRKNLKKLLHYLAVVFLKNGDLNQLIENNRKINKKFDKTDVINYSNDILNGLEYLHEELQIIHRDLKPS